VIVMSYDLMVFDAEVAPRDRKAFMAWYRNQTQWRDADGYDHHEIATPRLRNWYLEMIETFPPLNGPLARDDADNDADDSMVADYSIGRSFIYAAFSWSEADSAYEWATTLAFKHGVGVFDVSSEDSEVWYPGQDGVKTDEGDQRDAADDFPRIDVRSSGVTALSRPDERTEISIWNYLVGYVVIVGAMVGAASLGEKLLGIDGMRMVFLTGGGLFAWAVIGRPRALYLVVRNAGWFHHIRDPITMRVILAIIALLLLVVGALAPNGALK
jgi:hypothetical protein